MEISNQGLDTAPRRNPGREFSLAIRCPQAREDEVKAAVRAWIMFGGYGGRTRRGCGSLTVTGDASAWLPVTADCTSLQLLLGNGVFCAAPIIPMSDLPLLRGAELWAGPATANANAAWTTALGWLREFRQGSGSDPALHAREPAPPTDPNRPSLSRWPEADKMRHMYIARGYTCSHPPRHNDVPIWPRGNLGLPIVGRFQTFGRGGTPYKEPPPFMIYWFRRGEHAGSFERLASPLIVKALPLANGQFVPMALWFERGYPAGGEMGLYSKDRRTFVPGSLAPFDQLEAPRDTALFTILSGSPAVSGLRLRGVFFNWLGVRFGARRIAP